MRDATLVPCPATSHLVIVIEKFIAAMFSAVVKTAFAIFLVAAATAVPLLLAATFCFVLVMVKAALSVVVVAFVVSLFAAVPFGASVVVV